MQLRAYVRCNLYEDGKRSVYPLLETGRTEEGIPLSSKEIIPLSSNNKTNSWYFPSPPDGISRRIRC